MIRGNMTGKTKIYCAPMEGLTLFPFRQVHHAFYPGIDKYYTPFLVANQTMHFKKKEIRELRPENNQGLCTVPQILTNKAEEFLWAVRTIQNYGFREINLNLGCPSPTVVTRGRGAGMLADVPQLDRFFEEVFERMAAEPQTYTARISVKTRTGLEDHNESRSLMKVFNRYPICELTIHPRRRVDLYKGQPDWDVFEEMKDNSVHDVCYNGDISGPEDFERLMERFPDLKAVMIGRGLIRDPSLAQIILSVQEGNEALPGIQKPCRDNDDELSYLRAYLEELARRYLETIDGEHAVVCKMKEVWGYLGDRFPEGGKGLKLIRKARNRAQYEAAVKEILR